MHGALLDAEILADVYLAMTSGQSSLLLREDQTESFRAMTNTRLSDPSRPALPVLKPTKEEMQAHNKRLEEIDIESEQGCLWPKLDSE